MRHRPNKFLGFQVVVAGAVVVLGACSTPDAAVGPPPRSDAGAYWALTLDHRSLTMSTVAPYDTIRLTATPRDAAGNALGGLPRPAFTSSDVKTLQVDSNGVVHALAPGDGTLVIASLSGSGYTLADTAVVNVTDTATPPVLAVLSIHPDSGDSAEVSADGGKILQARALAANGDSIDGLSVYYTTSNPGVATIDRSTGVVQGVYPGRVTFTATATAYGVTKADTVPYVIGYPISGAFQIVSQIVGGRTVLGFQPRQVTLGTGASVAFQNASTTPVDVTFDDSTDVGEAIAPCQFLQVFFPWVCGTGNIAPFATDSTIPLSGVRLRGFPVPGTYNFRSPLFGTTGKIVIIDWHTIQ